MLEKPDLPDQRLVESLQEQYGLPDARVTFLPLGWDTHTAVYRLDARDGAAYFLKLRTGFDEIMARVPYLLHRQGVPGIIPPLPALDGRLWGSLEPYTLLLYPFVEGQNGYQVRFSERNWSELGRILQAVHTTPLPAELQARLPVERFNPHWRETVRAYQARVAHEPFADPISARLADFLRLQQEAVTHLVRWSERLARSLQEQPPEFVLCHSDAHPGNLHLSPGGALYLVDWDNPLLAPKELDLMFAGAGMGSDPDGRAYGAAEEALFYAGYSPGAPQQIDARALAYYRYERVVVDVAEFCDQIFLERGSAEERQQAFVFLTSAFLPGGGLQLADQACPPDL